MVSVDWFDILEDEVRELNLDDRLKQEKKDKKKIFPSYAKEKIFRAFYATPWEEVRVVFIGQEPVPSRIHATGLAFANSPSVRVPTPTLENIEKELHNDLGCQLADYSLEHWAQQGVLLLNTHLTINEDIESHADWQWEKVTGAALDYLNKMDWPIVFMLFGNHAKRFARKHITNSRHYKIETAHPLADEGFFGSRPFSRCNEFLAKDGFPIEW